MVQHSHPYMTTGKTIVLPIQTFVVKVMSLLFNMLSSFAIDFSSKEQASFNFMAVVTVCSDFGAKENKIYHASSVPLSICHEAMGLDAMIWIFFFWCWVSSQLSQKKVSIISKILIKYYWAIKKWNNTICSNMNGPRYCHTDEEVRQRETNIIWYRSHVDSKKMIQMNLFAKHK